MQKKTKIFNESVHKADYEDFYDSKKLDHNGYIFDRFRDKESLNGIWRFEADPFNTCIRAKWYLEEEKDDKGFFNAIDYSFDDWDSIKVPSCWNTEAERYYLYEGIAVYTRVFICRKKIGERVFLKFGAVANEAKIFVNGNYLGKHVGASTPFFVEITDVLRERNRIIVVVDNTRRAESLPAENFDWFNYGGIHRSIEILRLPETFIKRFDVALKRDGTFSNIEIRIEIDGPDKNGKAEVRIPELNLSIAVPVKNRKGKICVTSHPELWRLEKPKLYEVTCVFGNDVVRDRVGFREISVSALDILLNGEKIVLRGIAKHEDSVQNGRSLTEDEMSEDITLAKELGCNLIRLSHYPHNEKLAQLADENGILLWEEIPAYWAIAFNCEATCIDAENQLREAILRDHNRASVMAWCVCNENLDTDERLAFAKRMIRIVRETAAHCLVTAACMMDYDACEVCDRLSKYVDIISVNEYYGWYQNDIEGLPKMLESLRAVMDRPAVVSEFGADGGPKFRGFYDEKGTEDCQAYVYKRQVKELAEASFLSGTIAWVLYDFRTPRRLHMSQRQNPKLKYYNTKGVLSADK
ncbi:MAG: hypothetical protein LBS23_03210, partial [Holosporaceae bacterium]|nr:hypothetical protein [Holosporaceae bacterium]